MAEDIRTEMDMSTVLAPNGEFVCRQIGDNTILVPVKSRLGELDSLFSFNAVGAAVWRAVETRATVREIISAVEGGFEVDSAVAEQDVLEFVFILIERDLVRVVDE